MSYLIENNQCERTFLAGLGWSWDCLAPILRSFGIHPHCCWGLIEVDMKELVRSLKGDVDILVGRINWKDPQLFENAVQEHVDMLKSYPRNALIQFVTPDNFVADQFTERGELVWPPKPDHTVGFEVKCSRLNSDVNPLTAPITVADMKSTKASSRKQRKIRLEIEKLNRLGCDGVALLDLIAIRPLMALTWEHGTTHQ